MKKIISALTILLALLYFTSTFFSMGNTDFRDSTNPESYFEKLDITKTPYFIVYLKYNNDETIQQELLEIIKGNDLTAVGFTASKGAELQKNDIYIYVKSDVYKGQINTENNERVDFSDPNEKRYYSTVKRENAIMIDFLNPMHYNFSIPTTMRPFSQMQGLTTPTAITISGMTKDDFSRTVAGYKLESYIDNYHEIVGEFTGKVVQKGLQFDSYEILSVSLILCFASLTMLIIVHIVKHKKYIAVARMHGISKVKIMKSVFMSFFSSIFLTYAITQGLLLYFVAGPYRNVSKGLYDVILNSIIGLGLVIVGIVLVIYVYLSLYNNYHDLKQKKINLFSIRLNVIFKIIMSVLLMGPFISLASDTYIQTRKSISLFQLREESEDLYFVEVYGALSSMEVNSMASKDIKSKVYALLADEYNGIYLSTSEYYVEHRFNDFQEPYILVNKNYLKDYDLPLDEKGKTIELSSLKNGTILVPKKYKGMESKSMEKVQKNAHDKLIYVENFKEKFKPLTFEEAMHSDFFDNPIVYICDENNEQTISMSNSDFYVRTDNIKEVYNRLQEVGLSDYVSFSYLLPVAQKEFNEQFITFSTMAFLLISYLLVYLLFVYQSIFIYLDAYHRKLSIQYLNGYSYVRRYHEIYIINAVAYVIAGIGAYIFFDVAILPILMYILFFGGIEVLFEMYQVYQFERKRGIQSLK